MEAFPKILWKITIYYLYIFRIIYCPRFSSLLPNSCTGRMFMIYDSDIGSFLKIIWKTIIYFHIHIELHIVRVCLPYFQIDLIGEFLWFQSWMKVKCLIMWQIHFFQKYNPGSSKFLTFFWLNKEESLRSALLYGFLKA